MLDDLKIAIRKLRAAPWFTVGSVLTFALTIGVNVAILSIADAALFRPLPYHDPSGLFVIKALDRTGAPRGAVPYEYVEAVAQNHRGVESVGLRGPTVLTIHTATSEAEWMETLSVTPQYFQVLGIHPVRGRLFDESDLAAPPGRVVLLSHQSWKERFGGDESIIGRSVQLGSTQREVIGVLPPDFVFPVSSLQFQRTTTGRPEFVTVRATPRPGLDRRSALPGNVAQDPILRLKPGVSRDQAQAELQAIAAAVESRSPASKVTLTLSDPRDLLFPDGRSLLTLMLGAAIGVLLLGCANTANLLLARIRLRDHEIAVRTALGASRLRVLRPLVFEAVIAAFAGVLISFVVMLLSMDGLLRLIPAATYGRAAVGVSSRIAGEALLLAALGSFTSALLPIASVWSSHWTPIRDTGGMRVARRMLERPLIVLQVSLAVVLVSSSLLATRAMVEFLRIPLGFNPDRIVTLEVSPPESERGDSRAFFMRLVDLLAQHPDVLSSGAGRATPLDYYQAQDSLELPDGTRQDMVIEILPGYLETLGVSLRYGRFLTADDVRGDDAVAVVSESAGRLLFPGRDPIGERVTTRRRRTVTVVGVAADVRTRLDRETPPPIYVLPERKHGSLTAVARVRVRNAGILADLRRYIAPLVPGEPVSATWWQDAIEKLTEYRTPRFQFLVLGSFASLALCLTGLGVFSVLGYMVASRRLEMAIRLALGATPRTLTRFMIGQVWLSVMLGLAAGIGGALSLRRVAEANLYGIATIDAWPIVLGVITVAFAALVAAYLPARRAGSSDPALAFRAE